MIRAWKVENFKSVQNGVSLLDFGPITLFAGANSSGKSSIIQSILLMMQSVAARQAEPLVLNGDLVLLGTTEDLWNNSNLDNDLSVEFMLDLPDENDLSMWTRLVVRAINARSAYLKTVELATQNEKTDEYYNYARFEWDESNRAHSLVDIAPELESVGNEHIKQFGAAVDTSIRGSSARFDGLLPVSLFIEFEKTALDWSLAITNPLSPAFSENNRFDVPKNFLKVVHNAARELNLPNLKTPARQTELPEADTVDAVSDDHAPLAATERRIRIQTLADYQSWFRKLTIEQAELLQAYLRETLDFSTEQSIAEIQLPEIGLMASNLFEEFTGRIRYLSANRISPTIVFGSDVTSRWSEVGTSGANIADALERYGQEPYDWYNPEKLERQNTTLLEAAATWLRYFGLLEYVATESRGKLGTLLKIRSSGVDRDLDLLSVGFGTSQVLPIIVQGLLTPPGGVFIVEQPEVHLHPRVQSQLAHFFLALTRNRVQCVVETHSEHLVNELRLFIAEDNSGRMRDVIRMYFVERDAKVGSVVQEVMIGRNGKIGNWPRGFMDESNRQAERMLAAYLDT